jgi:ribosomal protein S27E
MANSATQRSYRAPCPGCGAPVEFKSAQSTHAVCGYCQSTVVRSGEVLTRLGKMAELFDDHSPLQLMASGRIQLDGKDLPFTLIGRLQYKGDAGVWTEWAAFLQDGTLATLGEDNGAYVFTRPIDPGRVMPEAARWSIGSTTAINGKPYSVAYAGQAQLISAQGELPRLPPLGQPFDMVELRSADGEVVSIDYGHQPPSVERGKSVLLEDLQLTGLKDESAKDEQGRQFNCPHCGAPVQVQLASSKSVTCGSCASIISLDSGVGGDLRSAEQDEPVRPIIPLGSTGQLQGVQWQVVGFQHRMGVAPGQDDDETEHFGWSEYLLYNQKRGFAFLVDSEEGWSLVRPTTGAPQLAASGRSATYLGTTYQLKYSYEAETTYVLGEFYWQVERGQKTSNRDFESSKGLLAMEQSPSEITWSAGDKLASDTVVKAFNLGDKKDVLQRDDPGPFVAQSGLGCGTIILVAVIIIILLIILSNCSGSAGSGYRSSGGSFGGYSSGGGHK